MSCLTLNQAILTIIIFMVGPDILCGAVWVAFNVVRIFFGSLSHILDRLAPMVRGKAEYRYV